MELSAYAVHEDAALVLARAATDRVRVHGVSTRGATVTSSHRLAGALRPLSAELWEEKCHNE